jgi:hypothetical protein
MADIHVTGSASCADTRALEGRSREISGHVAEEHTPGAKWCEYAGNIEMRPHQDLGRCICVADVREQEQRQESTTSTVHVDPPLSIYVVATVDVPPCVSRILLAWETNRNGPTDSFALNPTARSEERVVRFTERWRRGRDCESGTFGARETDDGLDPGLGIARIDSSRPQLVFDDVHAGPHSVRRHSTPDHKKAVRTEIVNSRRHLAHRTGSYRFLPPSSPDSCGVVLQEDKVGQVGIGGNASRAARKAPQSHVLFPMPGPIRPPVWPICVMATLDARHTSSNGSNVPSAWRRLKTGELSGPNPSRYSCPSLPSMRMPFTFP